MSIQAIEIEFAHRGIRAGPALLLDEKAALELIDRAALLGIPVRGIDQVRREHVESYSTLRGALAPQDKDPWTSWGRAREFIQSLAGRGLLFEVVLEAPPRTGLVPAKGFMTASTNHTFVYSAIMAVGMVATIIMVLMAGSLLR